MCSKSARPPHELCLNKRLETLTHRSRPSGPALSKATSPLRFFLLFKVGGLGVGSAVQRRAAAPWRAWHSVISTSMAATQSPDTDSLFSSTPRLRAQLAQLQNTLSLQMNKPNFQLKPLGAGIRLKTTQNRSKSPPFKETSTSNSATASPTLPLNKPYSCHNPLHTSVRTSCSRAVKRTRLRTAVSELLPAGD